MTVPDHMSPAVRELLHGVLDQIAATDYDALVSDGTTADLRALLTATPNSYPMPLELRDVFRDLRFCHRCGLVEFDPGAVLFDDGTREPLIEHADGDLICRDCFHDLMETADAQLGDARP